VLPVRLQSIKPAENEIIGFVFAYLLPVLMSGSEAIDPRVVVFIYFIFLLAAWNSNSYHFNPLIGLFGYRIYEVTTTENIGYILITRKTIRSLNNVARVRKLTDYMLIDGDD
jgi:hypothetical protein